MSISIFFFIHLQFFPINTKKFWPNLSIKFCHFLPNQFRLFCNQVFFCIYKINVDAVLGQHVHHSQQQVRRVRFGKWHSQPSKLPVHPRSFGWIWDDFWEVAASISRKRKTETNLKPVQWYKVEKFLKWRHFPAIIRARMVEISSSLCWS